MNNQLFSVSTFIILLCVFFTGCAEHRPRMARAPESRAARGIIPDNTVPATQKPYRIKGKTYYPIPTAQGFEQTGLASWYGRDFHGLKTSNGETYNMYGTTAAHKTLPMNTFLLVTNLENGKEITVRINDRGPFHKGRIIDLTKTGAEKLGFSDQGTSKVKITALGESSTKHFGRAQIAVYKEHPDFQRGDFYVQIGSFIDENNAQRLKKQIQATGRKVVIERFARGNLVFFRVQAQAGSTLTEAKKVESRLNSGQFPDAFVVAH